MASGKDNTELKLLWPFYLSTFLRLSFISAYAILYFMDLGFSYTKISILLSMTYITAFLFDVPTGAIADRYGRKISVITGIITTGILIMLIPLTTNYVFLLIIFFCWGITHTFISGSDEAWIVSTLKNRNKSLIDIFYARFMSIHSITLVFTPLIASFIATRFGMHHLWSLQGLFTIISGFVLIFGIEDYKVITSKQKNKKLSTAVFETFKQSKDAIIFSKKHPIILRLILATFFVFFVFTGIGMFWQPYLSGFNLPLEYFGYFVSITGMFSIFLPFVSLRISKRFKKKALFLCVILIFELVVFLLVLLATNIFIAAAALLAIFVMIQLITPIEGPLFQGFLKEKYRATVSSLKSTIATLGAGIATITFGIIADQIGPRYLFGIIGILLIPAILLYLSISKHKKGK